MPKCAKTSGDTDSDLKTDLKSDLRLLIFFSPKFFLVQSENKLEDLEESGPYLDQVIFL